MIKYNVSCINIICGESLTRDNYSKEEKAMKRLTAILTAALIALSLTAPVFAEPDESAQAEGSAQSSAVQEDTEQNSAAQESTGQSSPAQESTGQSSPAQGSGGQDSETSSSVRMMEYRINDADMNISIPSDMYVITRDTDENDPVLSLNRTDKKTVMEEFEANDIYLRASARDFSWVVSVMETENDDTETIGSLSSLSEKNLQQIIDKLLASEIYTGCAKNRFGGVLFLTFTIEYNNGETNVSGIQQYTIINDKNVRITYQTAAPADNDPNKPRLNEIMETVRFDGIEAEPSKEEVSRSLSVSDIDVRYIYIIAASLVGVIALMIMMIAGIKYSKSKKKAAVKPETEEKPGEESEEEPEEHEHVTVKDLEAFSEDGGFVPSVMSYKDIEAEESEEKTENSNDISNASFVNDLEDTGIIDLPDAVLNDTAADDGGILVKTAADMQDEKDENGEDIVFARAEKRRTEIEQVSDEGKRTDAEPVKPEPVKPEPVKPEPVKTELVKPEPEKPLTNFEKRFGKHRPAPAAAEPAAEEEIKVTKPGAETASPEETAEQVKAVEASFFDKMIDRLKSTSSEADTEISKTERNENGTPLLPQDDKETTQDMIGNSAGTAAKEGRKSDTIELEISRSADGSLVIGALDELSGKPVDIEIRDASNFREERDRHMARLGFETARDNEIYNAFRAENEEKPFVVRAKDESEIAADEKKAEEKSLTPETEEEFFEGVKTLKEEAKPEKKEEPEEKDKFSFERDCGIIFEHPLPKKNPIIPMQTVFTRIPRLDSVNAEEYNARYEEMIKTMPKNHAYAQRFSNANIPQPFVETARPHQTDVPPAEQENAEATGSGGGFEYYTGYEQGGDAYGAPDYTEAPAKEGRKKPGFGSRLKKFFSSDAQPPEDEE